MRPPLAPLALLALLGLASAAAAGGPSPAEALRALRGDGAADVPGRVAAARALENLPPGPVRDRALPVLEGALGDPSPDVRVAVATALARLDDPRALPDLASRLAQEPDAVVLGALLLAVGAVGRPDDVPRVAPYAAHPSARVRSAAATALGDLGGPAARRRLLELLARPGDDPDWAVRGSVFLALARCGAPEDAGTVLVAYRDGGGASQWFARATLATVVAALDPDPVPILDRLVADDDGRVASAAAAGFVRSGRPNEVVRRLDDARPRVRAAAAAAVADTELRRSLPRLRELATADPDRAVRWTAALALSRLDDPLSDALLLEGLDSDDPQVWAMALAECRRKTGQELGRDVPAWRQALAARRAEGSR